MAEAEAPGKLLLTGEYAVLDGAPGVSVACGGPARARAVAATEGRLADPAGGPGWRYRLGAPDRVHWETPVPGEPGRLPAAVLGEMLRQWPGLLAASPMELALDTEAFSRTDPQGQSCKLGLGSSAALTVAMVAAILRAAGERAAPAQFQAGCLAAHRAFQQGRGSGVDVLTAIHGGLLVSTATAAGLDAEAATWPASLQAIVVWTGRSASTPELIGRYDAFREREPVIFRHYAVRMADAAERAATAWRQGTAAAVLAAVRHYAECLRELDAAGQIGIWTAEHRVLAALADSVGAVYKPSGAGGGDLGFVLTQRSSIATALRLHCRQRGLLVLDMPLAVPGVRVLEA
jgi:phosphomevalonate kinase